MKNTHYLAKHIGMLHAPTLKPKGLQKNCNFDCALLLNCYICASAPISKVKELYYVLTPGRLLVYLTKKMILILKNGLPL